MHVHSLLDNSIARRKTVSAILLLASLSFVSIVRADIQLSFAYDAVTGATTATYSGSWGAWSGAIQDSGASGGISPAGIAHYGSTSSYINTSVFLGATIPWSVNTTTSTFTGDAWGFSSGRVIAPSNYTANSAISGSLTFAGLDLTALGFSPEEIASGGTIGSGSYVVHWTAASAIPEPATYALLGGAAALVSAMCLRRRGCRGCTA